MGKKQKLIKIDEQVAEKLENYSKVTTIDQQKIVEDALIEYFKNREV